MNLRSLGADVLSADVLEERLEFVNLFFALSFDSKQNSTSTHAGIVNLCTMLRNAGAHEQTDETARCAACSGACQRRSDRTSND